MPSQGSMHPNGSNFDRHLRRKVTDRLRILWENNTLTEKPSYMDHCERVPPYDLFAVNLNSKKVHNPYRNMIRAVLNKYPDLRFQDCFVSGNNHKYRSEVYRNDHPVMQFVTRQLQLMNEGKLGRAAAFVKTADEFRERRVALEKRQKLETAMTVALHDTHEECESSTNSLSFTDDARIVSSDVKIYPLYSKASAYVSDQIIENRVAHLQHISRQIKQIRAEKLKQSRNKNDTRSEFESTDSYFVSDRESDFGIRKFMKKKENYRAVEPLKK